MGGEEVSLLSSPATVTCCFDWTVLVSRSTNKYFEHFEHSSPSRRPTVYFCMTDALRFFRSFMHAPSQTATSIR